MYNNYNMNHDPNSYNQNTRGQPRIPKLTKSVAEEYIAINIKTPRAALTFVKIGEAPRVWKHACAKTGVTVMNTGRLVYLTGELIDFVACPACMKVIYTIESQTQY